MTRLRVRSSAPTRPPVAFTVPMSPRARRRVLVVALAVLVLGAGCLAAGPPEIPPGIEPTPGTPPGPGGSPGPTGPAVSGATAQPAANGRAYVSWQPAPDATRYTVATYAGSALVSTRGVAGTDVMVDGLIPDTSYTFTVTALGAQLQAGPPAGTNAIVAVGAVRPNQLVAASASADADSNRVTLQWQPAADGPVAEHYTIGVFENYAQVGAFICYAPCTERSVNLTPGVDAYFFISPVNPAGSGPSAFVGLVSVSSPCPIACISVDATTTNGGAQRRASGFLHSLGPITDPAVVDALAPRHWRVSAVWNGGAGPQLAADHGATITYLLSDDWRQATNTGSGAAEPWADWGAYADWVTSRVQAVQGSGIPVEYWEIQNEPGGPDYYPAGVTPTVDQLLEQHKVAYQAIKAADPAAKVVAPSLNQYSDQPGVAAGALDLRTFLDYAVFQNLKFDAISFHDIEYSHRPDEYAADSWGMQPDQLNRSVARLRALLAERPSLGTPAILVNEIGDPTTIGLPGWDVGRLTAVEQANVDQANRTCWGTCGDGWLDGLLANDGQTPYPGYWVYAFYAAMNGERAQVTTTNMFVTAFATVASDGVRVLVGRHEGCAPQIQGPNCPNQPTLSPGDVTVRIKVPYSGNVDVTTAAIPAAAAPLAGPVDGTTTTVTVNPDGTIDVTLPGVGDGDAWQVTVTPA